MFGRVVLCVSVPLRHFRVFGGTRFFDQVVFLPLSKDLRPCFVVRTESCEVLQAVPEPRCPWPVLLLETKVLCAMCLMLMFLVQNVGECQGCSQLRFWLVEFNLLFVSSMA